MAIKFQRALIPISYWRAVNNPLSIRIRVGKPYYDSYKYFLWSWAEFSKAKTKRRKANKLARIKIKNK
jgi:hypothetical protein